MQELSFSAIRQLLPSEWTIQEIIRDYGVDLRVEIFNNGEATGRGFLIQAKGTDKTAPEALKRQLEISTLSYLREQSEPTLLVRYLAGTGVLYGCWVHERVGDLPEHQKSLTVTWRTEDRLDVMRAADWLQQEVARFRRFVLTPGLRSPLRLVVARDANEVERKTQILLSEALRSAGSHLALDAVDGSGAHVYITQRKVRVDLAVSSETMAFPALGSAAEVTGDVLRLLATCYSRLGADGIAVDLFMRSGDSRISLGDHSITTIAESFVRSKRFHDAARVLTDKSRLRDQGFSMAISIACSFAEITHDAAMIIADAMKERARLQDQASAVPQHTAANGYYSAGNEYFQSAHYYEQALKCFEEAFRLFPAYRERGYFCAEMAAALFETGDLAGAIAWYGEARTIDPGQLHLIARLADAEAHAGRYGDANTTFVEYLSRSATPAAQWVVEQRALSHQVATTAILNQERDSLAAERAVAGGAGWDEVAAHDALCADFWRARVAMFAEGMPLEDLIGPLTVLVAFDRSPAWAGEWIYLSVAVFSVGDEEFFRVLAKMGYRHLGDDCLRIASNVDMGGHGLDENGYIEALNQIVEEMRASNSVTVVRFSSEDGSVDEVEIHHSR